MSTGSGTAPSTRGLSPAREVLPNGVTVIAKETRTTPAVTLHASVQAGTAYDPPSLGGVAHFVSRTLDRGTETRTADEIAEELDARGVALSMTVNRHVVAVVCTCLVEDFERILALVGDIVMRPTFPAVEVDTRRREIATLIRQDEDNPAVVAVEALFRELYGETHPYGRRPRGSLDSVERIDAPMLQRFHALHFVPGALSLALVGDVEPERAIDAAAAVFGGWRAAPTIAPQFPPVPAADRRRVRVIPMMNKAQTDIAYGFTTIVRSDPAYYAYSLMNNILGQYALGGRLGDRIREREGMAYYVFSALDANVVPGPLTVRAGVNAANVERAVAAIDQELSRLAREGPTEREMAESKQYLIGSMPRMLETNPGIANFLQTAEFFGLGLDYDVRLPELLRAVTRDEVHAAARRTLDPARAAVVVAGPYAGSLT
ncbi:MAG TPA: pitrilysin family protein [Vicinamibacterales bacterium]|nr:pitrilysin family protein [Vicinamibacterales bacterium]